MLRLSITALVGFVILVGGYLLLAPKKLPAVDPSAAVQRFTWQLEDGLISSGNAELDIRRGETLALEVRSNSADELHLHGYDFELDLLPTQPALLQFTADRAGRFEFELHKAHREIGVLLVQP